MKNTKIIKKSIEFPEEIFIPLKILAAKANKNLKLYIKDLLIAHVKK
jgi:hypothetical protein